MLILVGRVLEFCSEDNEGYFSTITKEDVKAAHFVVGKGFPCPPVADSNQLGMARSNANHDQEGAILTLSECSDRAGTPEPYAWITTTVPFHNDEINVLQLTFVFDPPKQIANTQVESHADAPETARIKEINSSDMQTLRE